MLFNKYLIPNIYCFILLYYYYYIFFLKQEQTYVHIYPTIVLSCKKICDKSVFIYFSNISTNSDYRKDLKFSLQRLYFILLGCGEWVNS